MKRLWTEIPSLTLPGLVALCLLWLALSPVRAAGNAEEPPLYLVVFTEQFQAREAMLRFEAESVPLDMRAKTVLRESQALSRRSADWLSAWLETYNRSHATLWQIQERYWLANAVTLKADDSLVQTLRNLPEIGSIGPAEALKIGYTKDEPSSLVQEANGSDRCPEESVASPETPGGKEPGLVTVQAPLMWARGYTGKGRRAMLMDTGVWPDHPALRGKFLGQRLGLNQSWYPYDEPKPADKSGTHGTHVVGTILGLDTVTRDTVGVAFGAYFIATDPIVTNLALVRSWTALMQAYQWALNPDGDTATTADIPDVINNSWGRDNLGFDSVCQAAVVAQALQAVEAAGTANVFSAGNDGPGPYTIGVPAQVIYDSLNVFCVGALNANNSLAGFSSNGPSRCGNDSGLAVKPEVSAPGVNIRSADGPSGYGQKSGTSMASPHVSGAVLLLKEAFPNLSGRTILNALYQTAYDLGVVGEDNLFGRGLIQVDSAYRYLASRFTPLPPRNTGPDLAILGIDSPSLSQWGLRCLPNSPDSIVLKVRIKNLGDTVVPGFSIDLFDGPSFRTTVTFPNLPMNPGQSRQVSLHSLPRNPSQVNGAWMFRVRGTNSNEADTLNNYWFSEFRTITSASDLVTEHFSDSIRLPFVTEPHRVGDWTIENPDQDDYTGTSQAATWYIASVPSTLSCPNPSGSAGQFSPGSNKAALVRMRDYSSRLRQEDHLISPPFYLSAHSPGSTIRLFFDVAYSNRNSSFRDSLLVGFSTDCGLTYTTVYRNGGDSLRTHSGINPADSLAFRRIVVDHPVLQQTQTGPYRLRFTTKNDFGGNLYLTNLGLFRFFAAGAAPHQPHGWDRLSLYPNPASGSVVRISTSSGTLPPVIHVTGSTGRYLGSLKGVAESPQSMDFDAMESSFFRYDVAHLSPGMYHLRIETDTDSSCYECPSSRVRGRFTNLKWVKIQP